MDGVHSLRRMSKEEKMAHIRDLYYASMMNDLDIRDAEEGGNSYGVPASKKAIVDLHTPSWGEVREDHGCVICLDDMEIGQKFRMMPCGHSFHQRCIFDWLHVNRLCPICQFAMPTDEEQRLLDEEEARSKMQQDDAGGEDMIIDRATFLLVLLCVRAVGYS
jgi:hypothetical protein